ncbi:GntR family transcriptional regulator [Acidianus manzaensis]|uniref:GntR family transcriptional regulator n=1 Tax=Acidianus manzaensis TaxID=282676 RepID=A0A1W6JWH0_9CREN|nr:GntR family transcriptional regulator [Acidianus manzaensis]ARM74608.1 GntR family transcriptional regulator [Acidianus manzaensis]
MTNITIVVNLEDKTPIYEQIEDQIIELIAKGILKPGDPIPSIRELASMLGINMLTVNKAYNNLVNEGYLTIAKKRYIVKSSIQDEKWKEIIKKGIYRALASNVNLEEIMNFISKTTIEVKNS